MRRIPLVAAVMASLGAAGAARAEAGVHEHDGLFLQLELGVGGMESRFSIPGMDEAMSGGAGEGSVALGGAVTRGLVVAARVWGVSVASPALKLNGEKFAYTGDVLQLLGGLGLDLTYYFMPHEFYLSATPSLGVLSVEANGHAYRTGNGFALRVAAGKEWWVSDNWGIGANLQYAHSANRAPGPNPPTWGTSWIGVAFSATYN